MSAGATIIAIDWFNILWDLIQRGNNLLAIERKTGIAEGTLREYLKGSQPPHWRGERLIELWCVVCERTRQDAPTTEVVLAPRVVQPKPSVVEQGSAAYGLEMWSRQPLLERLKKGAKQ